ncbi:MAG: VOC family protein [Saccharofermentanales bacterium]
MNYNPINLHHVGIVMPTKEQANRFIDKFHFEIDYSEFVPSYSSTCVYLKRGKNSSAIELIIPADGILKAFNKGLGGLHHIAIEVDDITSTEKYFRTNSMELLEEKAIECDSNILINFLQLRFGEGILIEFVQKKE